MDTVLITGVCGGMGSAAAKRLIDEGIKVIGMDVRESCHVEGIRYYRVDLASGDGLTEALADMTANGIGLSAIVHMSGIYDMNSLIEISEDSFSRIFEVNLFGIYRVNKTFFPLLEPASRIVMVSSELAPLDPLPFTGLYGITKSAVEKYAFSLRMELNLLGHSVIVIRPGAVETGLLNASTAALDKLCENTELYKYKDCRSVMEGAKEQASEVCILNQQESSAEASQPSACAAAGRDNRGDSQNSQLVPVIFILSMV